jgi:hypothetical protein
MGRHGPLADSVRAESLFQVNRNLEKQLRTLQTDVGRLKRKIAVFEVSVSGLGHANH